MKDGVLARGECILLRMGHYPFVIRCSDMQMYVGIELQGGGGGGYQRRIKPKLGQGTLQFMH